MKTIGDIRRSQVVSGNGPGALIDFRSPDGAPISVVAAGLETWDALSLRKGLQNEQTTRHEPLQQKLDVQGFRLPPVGPEGRGDKRRDRVLPARRFPGWHVCPKCNLLQPTKKWRRRQGRSELTCGSCERSGGGRKARAVHVIPVRFIVTCPDGHLQDFPWASWPTHLADCSRRGPLKLIGEGAGLKGLSVHCTECAAERSLEGALSPSALKTHKCRGDRPWLGENGAGCAHVPVAIQRGASNAYFPVIESALDVPPFGGTFREMLEDYWDDLKSLDDLDKVPLYVAKRIHPEWHDQTVPVEELGIRVQKLIAMLRNPVDLREQEHFMLRTGSSEADRHKHFLTRPQKIPEGLAGVVSHLVSVERLREVRALRGFTRLHPAEGGETGPRIAPLSKAKLNWLPAIEVRGEGIFVGFDPKRLVEWEQGAVVRTRAQQAAAAAERAWRELNGDERPFTQDVSARFLLIHTTAHAVAERLSLDSGYSTASVRERLYVSPGPSGMCGFLLYTSAPDSDGTLGGLSRLGRSGPFGQIFRSAIQDLQWCSSDPLCGTGILSLSEGSGLAACHCCTFVPEPSCEHFNRHLDRGMLVGTPDHPEIGYFRDILGEGA